MLYFKLDGKDTTPCTAREWSEWFGSINQIVAEDMIDGARVSTMFVGVDLSAGTVEPPPLFETHVYSGVKKGEFRRYATWEEAEKGHRDVCDHLSCPAP